MEEKKIRFRDLSGVLKTTIVFFWIIIGFYLFAFFVGLSMGIAELIV